LSSSVNDNDEEEEKDEEEDEKDPLHQMSGVGTTLRYMAAEVLLRQGYNLKADV
jgi:hypothetical protein